MTTLEISSVTAHEISNNVTQDLFSNIYEHICNDGAFSIVEQTAPFQYSGETYTRRTIDEYCLYLERAGFVDIECITIDFWLHRLLFERKIGKKYIQGYMKKHNITNRHMAMIQLNKNIIYKALSKICTFFSIPREFKNKKNRWGYCFIIAKKK